MLPLQASLRLGQELAPIELWAKEPKQIVALQGIQLQQAWLCFDAYNAWVLFVFQHSLSRSQVVCGASHVVALTNDGNVQAWGWLSEVIRLLSSMTSHALILSFEGGSNPHTVACDRNW